MKRTHTAKVKECQIVGNIFWFGIKRILHTPDTSMILPIESRWLHAPAE